MLRVEEFEDEEDERGSMLGTNTVLSFYSLSSRQHAMFSSHCSMIGLVGT